MAHERKFELTRNGMMLSIDGITNDELKFRNIRGEVSDFNRNGDRMFDLVLSESEAMYLYDNGWRVKKRGKGDDGKYHKYSDLNAPCEDAYYFMTINVNLNSRSPAKVFRCFEEDEDTMYDTTPHANNAVNDMNTVDYDTILNGELYIYGWKSRKDGIVTPYLDSAIFTVESNPKAARFAGRRIISDTDTDE